MPSQLCLSLSLLEKLISGLIFTISITFPTSMQKVQSKSCDEYGAIDLDFNQQTLGLLLFNIEDQLDTRACIKVEQNHWLMNSAVIYNEQSYIQRDKRDGKANEADMRVQTIHTAILEGSDCMNEVKLIYYTENYYERQV